MTILRKDAKGQRRKGFKILAPLPALHGSNSEPIFTAANMRCPLILLDGGQRGRPSNASLHNSLAPPRLAASAASFKHKDRMKNYE